MVDKALLLSILYKYYPKRVSAKFLSGFIPGGATKSEVNSVLYSNLTDFSVDSSYNWQLTLNAYELMKKQMQYKERKVNELCEKYNADYFVVKKLIEVDYQLFYNAFIHAEFLLQCGDDIPYLLPDDWLRLVTKTDIRFFQEVVALKNKKASLRNEWHEKFEKERKIKKLCSDNGINEKSYKQLLFHSPYEVERRINEIKAFMKKCPAASISISQAVLLNKEGFINYKNTFTSNSSYKCKQDCVSCTKSCILK